MSIKLIGLDLDGTLLNSLKQISDGTLDALQKTSRVGIHIVPVTGRPLMGIPRQLAALDFIRYMITSNGAIVCDRHSGELIRCKCLTCSQADDILQSSRPDIFAIRDVISDGFGHCMREVYQMMVDVSDKEYVDMSKILIDDIFSYPSQAEQKGEHIENVSIIAANSADCAEILKSVSSNVKNVRISLQGSCGFEVGSIDADKGIALLELGERLGINSDEIMAVGDGGNDIGMLSAVGLPVAMGNASQKLKDMAAFVTSDCDHDGVALAIKKFCI